MRTYQEMIDFVGKLTEDEISALIGVCSKKVLIVGNWYTKDHIKAKLDEDQLRDLKLNETLDEDKLTLEGLYNNLLDWTSSGIEVDYILDDQIREYCVS
jgi:hypothetical protein